MPSSRLSLAAIAATTVWMATHGVALTAQQQTLAIDGLRAPVEIVTDRWGINHIYAEHESDLFFAQGYAAAVVQLGATPRRVYLNHILPNVASTLIVSMTLTFPEIILMESGLSFLGLGVQPPDTSLGNMVGFGREYLTTAPWIMLGPAVVIMFTTLSISLVGDWLRDKLDPTIR